MCTSELPSLDLSQQSQNVAIAVSENAVARPPASAKTPEQKNGFQWPKRVPAPLPSGGSEFGSSAGDPQPAQMAKMFNPHGSSSKSVSSIVDPSGADPHLEIYSRTAFPSAKECATCHQQHYEEWASSSHAYAAISPMFNVFEDKINKLTQGTIGYFCMRCHAPVATTMGLRRDQAIWDGPRVFREGVTCVACHRVKTPYVKVNGERRIEPGDIYDPV